MFKLISRLVSKQNYNILIIEDDIALAEIIKDDIESIFKNQSGIIVNPKIVNTVYEAERELSRFRFDMGIFDLSLDGNLEGIELLKKFKDKVGFKVVHTSKDSTEIANLIYGNGANTYIVKQLPKKRIQSVEKMVLKFLINQHKEKLEDYVFSKFVTNNKGLKQDIMEFLLNSRSNDKAVHITGETGVGKEILSQLVQDFTIGPDIELEVVHCGTLQEDNVESKIFGHKKGSYTGAISDRIGVFEKADGKALLLDEIGDLPRIMQTQFLRIIDKKEGKRRGCEILRKYDAKVISATSANLEELSAKDEFQRDLLNRLKGHTFRIPPLSERRDDILLQIDYYQKKGDSRAAISPEVLDFLVNEYSWQGNSRELSHLIEKWKDLERKIELKDIKDLISRQKEADFHSIGKVLGPRVEKYGLSSAFESIELNLIKYLVDSIEKKEKGWKTELRAKLGNPSNSKWTGIKERYQTHYGVKL